MENSNINKCPWNLNSYFGRWMYYSWITNPKLTFVSTATVEEAKKLCLSNVCGSIPKNITDAQVLYAKQIYENAFHPDTAEKQNVFGRLSFMPIGKGILIATLLTQLSKSSSSYVLHGINQSYDSLVNFTNRNGDTKLSQTKLGISILTATTSSTLAAFYIERFLVSKISDPLLYRFIPLTTLLVASSINIPIMRHNEIIEGVGIYDCDKEKVGYSKFAAAKGIGETIITRMLMLAPGIFLIQYLGDKLENKSCWFRNNKCLHFLFKSIGSALILIGMLPTACAMFPQFSSVKTHALKKYDKEAYRQVKENCSKLPDEVYFNKGL